VPPPALLGARENLIDLDVQKFFDTVPWDRIIAAVEANTALPWVILYVKRWLAAPIQMPDGTLAARDRGTPQGSLCSAEHKDPYEQCGIMRSAVLMSLVRAMTGIGRCA
jgi:retron-type reverse transcriptase